MIELYVAATANGLRAAVALEECGLPYRAQPVDLAKGEQRSPEFLKLNPAGMITVIVDVQGPGGKPLTLSQSGAIVLYAAEKSGRFLPADPVQRLMVMECFMQTASDISGASNAVFTMENRAPEKSTANIEFLKTRLINYFAMCEHRLDGKAYLAGELSVADLLLYPNYALRKPLLDQTGGFANLHRWGAAMAARPGVARGMKILG